MSDKSEDMRTEPVEGAPVSLRKFIEAGHAKTELTIIVDGVPGRPGVAADDPNTFNILVKDREMQAEYFIGLHLPMPDYLRKYLAIIYGTRNNTSAQPNLDLLYEHAATNKGLRQMIGLIQLLAGAMNMAKKAGKGIRVYIEEPETHLHPAEQVNIPDLLRQIQKDYGPPEKPTGDSHEVA